MELARLVTRIYRPWSSHPSISIGVELKVGLHQSVLPIESDGGSDQIGP